MTEGKILVYKKGRLQQEFEYSEAIAKEFKSKKEFLQFKGITFKIELPRQAIQMGSFVGIIKKIGRWKVQFDRQLRRDQNVIWLEFKLIESPSRITDVWVKFTKESIYKLFRSSVESGSRQRGYLQSILIGRKYTFNGEINNDRFIHNPEDIKLLDNVGTTVVNHSNVTNDGDDNDDSWY